ncbi:MAG TPA: VOC family protein [Jatrophihabitans sp.]|uniref:VOC family protein n=1 Tax=Jatrophihabitans sp. TaxID=1932789 RepID=UPI002DF73811|nr:VOC family protein [Jatrophihabitans sp.]
MDETPAERPGPAPAALDLVTITAADLARSLAFYDAALAALGLVRTTELVDEEEEDPDLEAAAWGPADGPAVLWLVTGPRPTAGLHLRFQADSRVDVETFFAEALEHGGTTHTAPRRWTLYRRGEFHAIVRDPAGNLIEAVSAE